MRAFLAFLFALLASSAAQAATQFTDIACETSTTTGTGTLNLDGAKSGGYLGFAAAGITSGNSVPYSLVTGTGATRKLETGFGTFTNASPDTLTRVAAWSSDGSGAELNLTETSTVCVGPIASLFTMGAGSTIDADKLDGISSTGFLQSTDIGVTVQAWDADLDSWAAITRAAGFDTFTATPSSANFASLITDESYGLSDAELAALAGLTSAADKLPYFTGSGTAALADLSSSMRTFFTTPSCANLASVTTDEAFNCADGELGALSGLTSAADKVPYFTGSGTAALADFPSAFRTVLTSPSSANFASFISDDAFSLADAELGAVAGLTSAADKGIYFTGSGTAATFDLSSAERTWLTTPSSANFASVISDDVFSLSDVELGALAGLTSAASRVPYFTGSGTAALFAFTPTDDGFDVLAGWDESDNQYESLALAEIATEASPASGDYVLIYGAEGDLRKVDWSNVGGGSGANTALSNLASVAINTSLISDADSTDDLGSTTFAWDQAFVDNYEFGQNTDTTLTRTAAGEAAIEGDAIKHAGRQTIPLLAGAGVVPVGGGIAGCTPVSFDSGSNDVFMRQCQFSASTDNAIYYTFFFPKSASESTDLVVQVDWTSATTTDATDDVIWNASAVCFSNDDAINGNAFPADDAVTDTQTAAGDYLVSGEITAITPAGTPAEGDACVLRIRRDADNASDNFNGTADLIQARLYYTDNASSDD